MSVANTCAGYPAMSGAPLTPYPLRHDRASRSADAGAHRPWREWRRGESAPPRHGRRASTSCGRVASAVDAAIATNAALAVVAGHSCGLGGDAFWLIDDPATAGVVALNGSGRSAAGATLEAAAAAGPGSDARARAVDRDRAGRRRLVGRGPPAIRTAALGGPPGTRHRAGRWLPGERRLDRRRGTSRGDLRHGRRLGARLSAAWSTVAAGRAGPPAGARPDPADPRRRRTGVLYTGALAARAATYLAACRVTHPRSTTSSPIGPTGARRSAPHTAASPR